MSNSKNSKNSSKASSSEENAFIDTVSNLTVIIRMLYETFSGEKKMKAVMKKVYTMVGDDTSPDVCIQLAKLLNGNGIGDEAEWNKLGADDSSEESDDEAEEKPVPKKAKAAKKTAPVEESDDEEESEDEESDEEEEEKPAPKVVKSVKKSVKSVKEDVSEEQAMFGTKHCVPNSKGIRVGHWVVHVNGSLKTSCMVEAVTKDTVTLTRKMKENGQFYPDTEEPFDAPRSQVWRYNNKLNK